MSSNRRVAVPLMIATLSWPVVAASQNSADGTISLRTTAGARVVTAARAATAPTIDGRLDDVAWALTQVATEFVQQFPDADRPASQRTEARVVFTSDALFVGMRLYDTRADSVVGTLARRDFVGYSDWAHVIVDSRHDRRTAYRFAINPGGVKRDGFIPADAEWSEDLAWDAVWDAVARRDSTGWTAEFRIPLSQLRFAAGAAGGTWGIQFARDVARRGERSVWTPAPPNGGQFVSVFGALTGVAVADARRRLELTPYVVARGRASSADTDNPLRRPRTQNAVGGADFKVGLTSDLTLTGTINPDFGQVEADPSLVNLTGAESFFPEARPFFKEGSNLFEYSMSWAEWIFGAEELFYSRRVGRQPQLDFPDSADYTTASEPTRLLGAAKLSGRALGLNLGVLSATTAQEVGRYGHAGGVSTHVVEPLTHYGVYRLGRDFARGDGSVGVIATSTNRSLTESSNDVLHRQAYAGGVEARRRFGGNYAIAGHFFGSSVRGTEAALAQTQTSFRHLFQRDADNMGLDSSATSLSGLASEVRFEKASGFPWRFGGSARVVTKGFDVSDVGFMNGSNFVRTGGWLGLESSRSTRFARRLSSFANLWAQRSIVGGGAVTYLNWWNYVQFHNQWSVSGWVEHYLDGWSPSLLRGGPGVRTSGTWSAFYTLNTDPRRRLAWLVDVGASPTNADGSRFVRVSPGATVRPAPQAELRLQPSVEHRRNAFQFVDRPMATAGRRYIVGDLRQRTVSLTARGSYAFTPQLTVQAYAQPFLSNGTYARVGEVTNASAPTLDERVRYIEGRDAADETHVLQTSGGPVTIDNPDFSITNLNANVVLRWEYRPGSTLYAVWNQGRAETDYLGGASLRALGDQLGAAPATNVLLLKWSHYMGR